MTQIDAFPEMPSRKEVRSQKGKTDDIDKVKSVLGNFGYMRKVNRWEPRDANESDIPKDFEVGTSSKTFPYKLTPLGRATTLDAALSMARNKK